MLYESGTRIYLGEILKCIHVLSIMHAWIARLDFVKKVGRNGSIPVLHTKHRVRIMFLVQDKILRKIIGKHKKECFVQQF